MLNIHHRTINSIPYERSLDNLYYKKCISLYNIESTASSEWLYLLLRLMQAPLTDCKKVSWELQ